MSYKKDYIERITREILRLDKSNLVQANRLRETRKKAKSLHGNHFVPKRFPSPEYNSLSLSFK